MSPTENARTASAKAPVQSSLKRNALILCVLGCLSGMPLEAASYVEQGRLNDAASWRSEEFKSNWGLAAIGADFAYARGLSGKGVQVAIYDSGTDLRHNEFMGKAHIGVQMNAPGCSSEALLSPSEGCFFTEGDRSQIIVEDDTFSYIFHGTHVAGTVAANREGTGMHGVAYASTFSALRFATNESEYLYERTAGPTEILAAYAQLHGQNVRVINNSWGPPFTTTDNETELDADLKGLATLAQALGRGSLDYGFLQVWAAGNTQAPNASPQTAPVAEPLASLPRARPELEPYWLSVINLQQDLTLNDSSHRCGFSQNWCIAAPGTDITSSTISGEIDVKYSYGADGRVNGRVNGYTVAGDTPEFGYRTETGTSFAAPHVTGGLALLMERFPYLDNPQIRDVLLTTATDLGAPGVDDVYGWGLMNLKKAIDGPGQLRVDTSVNLDRPAGGAIVWQGGAWDDWRNDIGGPGRLEKTGIGWLRLSGNNSFAGATLKQGILELDGTNELKGDVNVDGGVLRLNGSLAVAGDYTQAAGSTLMTGLADQAAPAKLQVQNQASINGGSLYLSAQPNHYYLGQRYSILQAQGALTGEFTSIDRREFSPFLSVSQVKQGNNLLVEFGRGHSLASAAQTTNQRAVATAADEQAQPSPLLQRLTALFPEQAPSALDQLSGELHASTQAVLIENSRVVRQAALDRQRLAQDSRVAALDARNQGVWVQLPRQSGQLAGDSNTTRTHHNSTGLLLGFDHTLEQGTHVGVVAGSGRTDVRAGSRGKASVDTYQLALHAGHTWDAFGLYGGIAYAQHEIETKRRVSFPGVENRLSAKYASRTVQTFAEANYTFSHDAWDWQPYLQLANVQQRSEGFKERGGMAALKGKGSKENVNLTTGGVRVNLDLGKAQIGPSWLSLRGGLAYTHASGDLQPTTQAAWDGGRVMSVSGAPLDRLSTRLELGATARLSRDSSLDFGFSQQRGERTRDQSLTAQYTLQF